MCVFLSNASLLKLMGYWWYQWLVAENPMITSFVMDERLARSVMSVVYV